MQITVRAYQNTDLEPMLRIWNQVVDEGMAFPQEEPLDRESGAKFFARQTYTAVAADTESGEIYGLYILHPNNEGRCGHICNASYAVYSSQRGQGIGRQLVLDCLEQGRRHGFSILQFNAVVAENCRARQLYESLGFIQLGTIPGGFRLKDGRYADICPYYRTLE